MKLAVMAAAELHGELVPDFLSQSAGLRKAQVMWVAGLFAAGEAGLIGHKAQVALSALLGQDEDGPL